MSTVRAIFKSTLWNHGGRVLEYVLMYVASVLIARGLGLEANGVYAGLISFSQLLFVLSSFGLETSLNKHIPQLGEDRPVSRTRFLLRRLLLIRLLLISAGSGVLWGVLQFVEPVSFGPVREYLWILVLFAAVRSLVPLLAMTLTAQLRTGLTAKINLATRSLELAAILFLLPAGLTVPLLFMVLTVSGLIQLLSFLLFARENVIGEESFIELRPVITFGAIFWGNTLVDFFLGRQGDVLLLMTLLSDSTQASVYDVAYSVVQVATLSVTVGLTGVSFATFARLAVTSQSDMNRFYGFLVRMVSLAAIPVYTFLLFNADAIVRLLYSTDYALSALPLQIMAGSRLVARIFGGGENAEYLLSRGHVKALTLIGVFAAATNIGLDIVVIPKFGAGGAAGASGVANLTANFLTALLIYRLSENRVQALFWLKIATVAIVSAGVTTFLIQGQEITPLIMRGTTFGVMCIVIGMGVKPLHGPDADWLSRIDQRLAPVLRLFSSKSVSVES